MEYRIANLSNKISGEKAQNEEIKNRELLRALEVEQSKQYQQYGDFQKELIAKYPSYAKLQDVAIASADNTRRLLSPEEVFISYIEYDNYVAILLLDNTGNVLAQDLGHIDNLGNIASTYAKLLKAGDINTLNQQDNLFLWQLPDGSFEVNDNPFSPPPNSQKANTPAAFDECLAWMGNLLGTKLLTPIEPHLTGKNIGLFPPTAHWQSYHSKVLPVTSPGNQNRLL